jgi:hypothetical protein
MHQALPIFIKAIHICLPDSKSVAALLLPPLFFIMGKFVRQRCILHYGSPKELLNELERYNISASSLPPSLGGTFALEDYCSWVDQQRQEIQ